MRASAVALALLGAVSGRGEIRIENQFIEARLDDAGKLSLADKADGRVYLRDAQLSAAGGAAEARPHSHKIFGAGRSIVVQRPDGSRDQVMLFPNLPFAFVRATLTGAGSEPVRKLVALSAELDLGKPASALKTLGTGGLLSADKNPGSYVWLAVADPAGRSGVVLGWLTGDRGSGVLFSSANDDRVQVRAQIDYGRLLLAPGETEEGETLAVGYFEDARLGLEAWADAVAAQYRIRLPAQPAGYCTWYSQPHGGASDETHLAEQSVFAATNLAPFGFSVIQIDDKWQAGISTNGPKRNFTTHAPNGPYPSGMKAAADRVKSVGLVPGIWFMPFAGTYYDPFFAEHQDWFVKHQDGSPYETAWGGTSLDMTHPGAQAHLRELVRRIGSEWGYQYFKMDGLSTGIGARPQYVNSGYKDEGLGDAVFHNPRKTNIEAYRDGLRLVRETAGPKVFILGCCAPQNMRSYGGAMGLVDAMRIGPDNGANWKGLLRGPTFGSRHYFLNGRVWYNDPDPVYARESVPLNQARVICSWVTLSGQLNLSSEWLPGLPPERLDLLKRTMPAHGHKARPADLFENELLGIWLVSDRSGDTPRDVVGLFNWENQQQNFDYPLDRLGLEAKAEYVVFEYWQNRLLPPWRGRAQATLPPQTCGVYAVRKRSDRPQLISTSRHITQGMVDVITENWDSRTKTLSGRSTVVGGDAYELRVAADAAPEAFEVSRSDDRAGVKAELRPEPGLVRATLRSAGSREVKWSLRFR